MNTNTYPISTFSKAIRWRKLLTKGALVAALITGISAAPVLQANANNLAITGTSVSGQDISFNISWDNSWNTNLAPANHDAVWVFVKIQDCNTQTWQHAGLSNSAANHSAGSPLQVDPVGDGKGVFIRRSALGGGATGTVAVSLRLAIPPGTYNYKIYGIEMVNIPQGAFEVGDATSPGTFASVTIDATAENSGLSGATLGGSAQNVPAAFPAGYNGFYSMKYEVTQEQYAQFLNTLTYQQQQTRSAAAPNAAAGTMLFGAQRNGVQIVTSGSASATAVFGNNWSGGTPNGANDNQNVAMNYLSWADLAAYLDWAALRPMTELEFEKIARGAGQARVGGEYVWGTTGITQTHYGLVANPGTATEVSTSVGQGLCAYGLQSTNASYGPLRTGFAATGTTGRAFAGAAYYGPMDMSGNVWERAVTVGNGTGVAFTGTLGDGNLDALGEANVASWPGVNAVGAGYKGGDYYNVASYLRTSDRQSASSISASRDFNAGGRGVR